MRRVVRILLCGGLGNQLFQYAFGRALADHYNAQLQIDIGTGFMRDYVYRRNYELDVFQLPKKVSLIEPSRVRMQIERIKLGLAQRKLCFSKYYLIESTSGYSETYKSLDLGCRITTYGYWQDLRYFSGIQEKLRVELQFTKKLSPSNQLKAQEMQATESVAVHVRRVQYDSAVGLDYYTCAIPQMLEQVPNAKLYCFSDDLDWCRENLLPKYPLILVDNQNMPAIEDFQLMTHCRHFITANSSFSWWAAWLGGMQGCVIAPIVNNCQMYNSIEKLPQHWKLIDYP